MVVYRILQVIVVIADAVLLCFFAVGLGDGSIDSSNILLWLIMLAVPTAALIGASHLYRKGQRIASWLLLAVPAVPTALYGLFILLVIVMQPDFR